VSKLKKIKLFDPKFDSREIHVATKALKSSHWASGLGIGKVSEFESKFRNYTNAKECVAVNSGTAALHLALNLFDVKRKEVLVPSLTFISTIHSILYNGGKPRFVDIDPNTLCIDPIDIERKVTKNTAAIIPVHFGGMPSDIKKISKIADQKSLQLIYDAAHACGANNNKKKIGSEKDIVCFSFHPIKNLAMPKGGAITINTKNSRSLKKKLNSLRWCGIGNRDGPNYDITTLGFNYYMDEISASIGIEQLKKLERSNAKRFDIAKRYSTEIKTDKKMPINKNSCYHLYWIRVKNRNKFLKNMASKGIEVGVHYPPAHNTSFYQSNIHLPITESIGKEIVTLPMHPNLKENDIDMVIKTTNHFIF